MTKTSEGIFVRTHRRDFGPYSETELTRHVSSGRIPFSSWIYREGKWVLLAELADLREKHPQFEKMPDAPPQVSDDEDQSLDSLTPRSTGGATGAISTEPVWFLIREKKKYGPYSSADIVRQLQHKELERTSYVWRPGFPTWQKLSAIGEFSRESMEKLIESGAGVDVIVKRKKARAPYEVEVIAHDNTRALEGKSMVIGEGGLFLSVTKPSHQVGARLRLHFREGDTAPFNAVAEVVSVVKGEAPGYCMKFVAIADSDRRKIAKLVSERRKSS